MQSCFGQKRLTYLCFLLVLTLVINLIGCGGSGCGSKYSMDKSAIVDATIVQTYSSVDPARDLKITDGSNFSFNIPANSLTSRYSVVVTKTDLAGKDEAEIAVIAKKIGLPEGYMPTSSLYNISILMTEIFNARAAIAMNTAFLLNETATILLNSFTNLDWEAYDYYIAVLDGGNNNDSWHFMPRTQKDLSGSNGFMVESKSLGKTYLIVKKAKNNPEPTPTPDPGSDPDPNPDPTPTPVDTATVNGLDISSNIDSVKTDTNKMFETNVSISLSIKYTGTIDFASSLPRIRISSTSPFEFSDTIKALNDEGGMFIYTSDLGQPTLVDGEAKYSITIPLEGITYDKQKHPASFDVIASFTLGNNEYRSAQLSINLVPPAPEPIPLILESVSPLNDSTNLPLNTCVVFNFSEEMDTNTEITNFSLTVGEEQKAISQLFDITVSDKSITLTPKSELAYGTKYVITALTSVKSAKGKSLVEAKSTTFTTIQAEAPIANKVFPANDEVIWHDASQQTDNNKIVISFTEKMDLESLKTAFVLKEVDNTLSNYDMVLSEDGKQMIVTLSTGTFKRNVEYSFVLNNTAKSQVGKILESELSVEYQAKNFLKGEGTADAPYEIYTAADLDHVRNCPTADFIQKADIYLANYRSENCTEDEGWMPIDGFAGRFEGNYNGDGHKVSNLFIKREGRSNTGLFGFATGKIINLGVGIAANGISGCVSVGGLVGFAESCTISNCYAFSDDYYQPPQVTGVEYVGGLVGQAHVCEVSNCYAFSEYFSQAQVTGGNSVGGLVGFIYNGSSISNCYASDQVTGGNSVGGLVGEIYESTIKDSVALNESISASSDVGRVVGNCYNGSISNCYAYIYMEVNGCIINDGSETVGLDKIDGKKAWLDNTTGLWTDASNWTKPWNSDIWILSVNNIEYPTLKVFSMKSIK